MNFEVNYPVSSDTVYFQDIETPGVYEPVNHEDGNGRVVVIKLTDGTKLYVNVKENLAGIADNSWSGTLFRHIASASITLKF